MGRMAEGRWRLTAHAAAVMLALAALTACTPDPTPTPSPTGFASDEEAFAAAEDTYRAYIDASNAQREDPDSLPSPTDFLTGDALTNEIDSQREITEQGLQLVGPLKIHAVNGVEATSTTATIGVCLDVSGTRVLNTSDQDVTPADRESLLGLQVEVVTDGARTYISSSIASDDEC